MRAPATVTDRQGLCERHGSRGTKSRRGITPFAFRSKDACGMPHRSTPADLRRARAVQRKRRARECRPQLCASGPSRAVPRPSRGAYDCRVATRTVDYLDAVRHLPEGSTLVPREVSWDDYERVVGDVSAGPHRRVSYDRGRLEIMTPLPEHETSARLMDALVRVTRKNAARRIIGKRHRIDLESDPPPDVAVEIDLTNESPEASSGFAPALLVPEVGRYDAASIEFYVLDGHDYQRASESRSFPGLTPSMLADAGPSDRGTPRHRAADDVRQSRSSERPASARTLLVAASRKFRRHPSSASGSTGKKRNALSRTYSTFVCRPFCRTIARRNVSRSGSRSPSKPDARRAEVSACTEADSAAAASHSLLAAR
jgi:Uma2 family endonuclease